MRILVHIDDAELWRETLAKRMPEAEVFTSDQEVEGIDYLAVWKPPARLLERHAGAKGIVNLGAGVDALLNNPGLPKGVPIVKLHDAGMGELMADYVRYGVLHFQRDFDRYLSQEADALWREIPVVAKRDWGVGILGLGAIGTHVAQTLAADGFPVHGWSRSPKRIEGVTCHHGDAGLRKLLGQVHTLVTLLPDTPSTRHIVNADTLAALPNGATLINPGRGTLVDETALLEALGPDKEEGHLRGALLDAFPEEPLTTDSPLWAHPRVRITPHMAAPTPLDEAVEQVVETVRAWEAGESVPSVDPEAGY
ncbi:glyoxylate/hydroxypyruvate reductase A [Litchfieldella qijiaojingensis]|uniref:Glyoxylate/hydroxypyruvate reductase A n=1 Tax=Litchfieldella qijiaojingensis TaxID=980347 RepID=A0ABQ2YJE2_9GAMM|nr:glyoxylate/hydroxypyruvate reductase A [Halomonas qijiaojingensis]GGX86109.1 glyoxylate/hydroxypyruvate reductase A [Halomonas qijiaojingensis]